MVKKIYLGEYGKKLIEEYKKLNLKPGDAGWELALLVLELVKAAGLSLAETANES